MVVKEDNGRFVSQRSDPQLSQARPHPAGHSLRPHCSPCSIYSVDSCTCMLPEVEQIEVAVLAD